MKKFLLSLSLENFRRLLIVSDFFIIVISIYIGFRLSPFTTAVQFKIGETSIYNNLALFFIIPMVVVVVNHSMLLHEPQDIVEIRGSYIVKQIFGILIGFIISYWILYFIEYALVGRYITLYSLIISSLFNISLKLALQKLVFPANLTLGVIAVKSAHDKLYNYISGKVVYLVNKEDIVKLKSDNKFTDIVEYSETSSGDEKTHITAMINHALFNGLRVRNIIDWIESSEQKIPVELISYDWFVTKDVNRHLLSYMWVKDFIDKLVASGVLIFAIPIMLVTYILVKLDDSGPFIYKQARLGLYGKEFYLYKIRSMKTNAETNGPKWASINDTRVTRIGKYIRKLRIDELPQLFNVIRGDMSIVGPRPERKELAISIEEYHPLFKQRLLIKPGVTGWAQINYPYGASIDDGKKKLEYDLYYLKNISLLLDLQIILRTLASLTKGSR